MPPEYLSALASVATFIVITVTAIAALIQLRHLRATNQLESLVGQAVLNAEVLGIADGIFRDFPAKVEDPAYRKSVGAAQINFERHPELRMMLLFEQVGVFLKKGLYQKTCSWRGMEPSISACGCALPMWLRSSDGANPMRLRTLNIWRRGQECGSNVTPPAIIRKIPNVCVRSIAGSMSTRFLRRQREE